MKANEFIKKYGIEEAKKMLNSDDWSTVSEIFILNLRYLVDSYDIVEKYKVFDVPRWHFIADYCKENRISPFDSRNYSSAGKMYDDAVKDMESCQ